jgi:hypothetical protein
MRRPRSTAETASPFCALRLHGEIPLEAFGGEGAHRHLVAGEAAAAARVPRVAPCGSDAGSGCLVGLKIFLHSSVVEIIVPRVFPFFFLCMIAILYIYNFIFNILFAFVDHAHDKNSYSRSFERKH